MEPKSQGVKEKGKSPLLREEFEHSKNQRTASETSSKYSVKKLSWEKTRAQQQHQNYKVVVRKTSSEILSIPFINSS